ncbi:MAG: sugar ABC transporter ATP-binding protein [Propioniciclava sp.]
MTAAATSSVGEPILQVSGLVKTFGGEVALGGVDLTVGRGEVHALLGANGAGKSTLIKCVTGIHAPDAGDIVWRGSRRRFRTLRESIAAGMATMFQQLNVVEDLTVGGYLSLGREQLRRGIIDRGADTRMATAALARVGVELDVQAPMESLSVAERELVEIARAASLSAELVIMDEPTASLGEAEIERLFGVIESLRRDGVSVIYVSHKLKEVLAICQRATVLRDGQNAGSIDVAGATTDDLLKLMVGQQSPLRPKAARALSTHPLLELDAVSTAEGVSGVSLTVHEGEVVGLYGLMGSGRTEVLRAIYGQEPLTAGTMRLDGKPWAPSSARAAVRAGLGLVPEDRVREAMIPDASVAGNITMSAPATITSSGVVRAAREQAVARSVVADVGIKTAGVAAPITSLSGGNQQKVILGRWMAAGSSLLLLDDPTVGVDVAAKNEIYKIIEALVDQGHSVLVCSSELDEIVSLCDRVAIMHQGCIVRVVQSGEGDAESLIRHAIMGAVTEADDRKQDEQ